MNKLPPLNALKAFYHAAEQLSFVHAGRELGVSAAAISQQVKNLEIHLGNELFSRRGNKLSLTDSGEAIFQSVSRAFAEISDTAQHVRTATEPSKIVMSALPSISERWLLPKMIAFRETTGVSVELRVEADPVQIMRHGVDIRITNKSKYYADFVETELFRDVATCVCSAEFWQKHGGHGLSGLSNDLFIHNDWGPEFMSEPTWKKYWFALGINRDQVKRSGYTINSTSLAISLACAGVGIALVPRSFVQVDLQNGNLIEPVCETLPMEKSYVCLSVGGANKRRLVSRFIETLKL